MLNLEDFMNIRDLKQQGWSVSAIADELNLDRKTVRKHLVEAPQPYKRENPASCKIDPYRPFLRERWEQGVHNACKLLEEIRSRGYDGGYSPAEAGGVAVAGRKGANGPSCASKPVQGNRARWTGVTSATGAGAGSTASR